MAVGTVSTVEQDNWQLIATNSPSAASTTSFTSISGYKTLMVAYKLTGLPDTTGLLYLRFNGDSTAGNYGANSWMQTTYFSRQNDRIPLTGNFADANQAGYVIINNTNSSIPKIINDAASMSGFLTRGVYIGNAVTSIEFAVSSPNSFSGTVYLYGIAA
jgi:hypothetical protein